MHDMKNLDYALLLEVYECMLTDRQRELMEFYYWEDMSLGEISECIGITRQAVRDGIKRSEQVITQFETKLKFAEKSAKTKSIFEKIFEYAQKSDTDEDVLKNIRTLAEQGREMFS